MNELAGVIDRHRTKVAVWFAVIVFAYYYKAVLFGFFGHVLGIDFLGSTWVRGISIDHWIEIVIYCPLLWLALHQVNADVFGDLPADPEESQVQRRRQLIGEFAIALVIYGTGVHIANAIEIFAREHQGIETGEIYDLVYFIDEGMSHYLQFVPLFFVIGWFLGPPTVMWLALAAFVRWRRFRRVRALALDDFLFRYAVAFCVTLPLAQLAYLIEFGSFAQPSGLGDSRLKIVAVGAVVLTVLGTALFKLSEPLWNPASRTVTGTGSAG
jgi:hypothetical protein